MYKEETGEARYNCDHAFDEKDPGPDLERKGLVFIDKSDPTRRVSLLHHPYPKLQPIGLL